MKFFLVLIFTTTGLWAQGVYSPSVNDVVIPGTSNEPLIEFEDKAVVVTNQTTSGGTSFYHIQTEFVNYTIVEDWKQINCFQRRNPDGSYNGSASLKIKFDDGDLLDGISYNSGLSQNGYKIFLNSKLILAIHSDGTLWAYIKELGKDIEFLSLIDRDYDMGGGKMRPHLNDEAIQGKEIRKRNWLVIEDDPIDDVATTGGFGVYTRPVYRYTTSGVQYGNKDYYATMVRNSSNEDFATLTTTQGNIKSQSSFIVSIFPNKYQDRGLLRNRTQYIYPGGLKVKDSLRIRNPYEFPNLEELRAWADPNQSDYLENGYGNGFYFWDVLNSQNTLEINTLVLFESIWMFGEELGVTDYYSTPIDPNTQKYIPFNNSTLVDFLNMADIGPFQGLKVILYVSANREYNTISTLLGGEEYYDLFMNFIANLYTDYPQVEGIYIDTLPLNGNPENFEPMIVSYRIMRDLKRLYPDKFVMLHSSENPLGTQRLRTSLINGESFATYVQFDIFAPFIDRYADIMIRGEAYPMSIDLVNGQVPEYITKHIKYVVNPYGKSNTAGQLIWSKTRADYSEHDSFYPDMRNDYISSTNLPVSKHFPGLNNDSRLESWYQYNDDFGVLDTVNYPNMQLRINRLFLMNTFLENYIEKGYLTGYSNGVQDSLDYWKHYRVVDPPPFINQTNSDRYKYAGFGPNADFYRCIPMFWRSSYDVANDMSASISGPGVLEYKGAAGQFTASQSGGNGPYSYSWQRRNKNGFSWGLWYNLSSTTKTISANMGVNDAFDLKVTVTDKNGFSATDVHSVINDDFLIMMAENAGEKLSLELTGNYPNPFNPITTIKYQIPEPLDVKLLIYNIHGQLIKTLVNKSQDPGKYEIQWKGENESGGLVSSGIYFYQLRAGKKVFNKKLFLLK